MRSLLGHTGNTAFYESILQGARMLEDEQTMVSHTLEAKVDCGGIANII